MLRLKSALALTPLALAILPVASASARAYSPTAAYKWYWTTDFGGCVDQSVAC